MKKTLLLTLVLTLILTLVSCTTLSNDDTNTTDITKESETKPVSNTNQPTLKERKEQIKKQAIQIMQGDGTENNRDFNTLPFAPYMGDYSITSIESSNSSGYRPSAIYRKGGVSVTKYTASPQVDYNIDHGGYLISVITENGDYPEISNIQELDDDYTPSIFFDCGINFDLLMNGDGDSDSEEDDSDEPELTPEKITVSDDLTTCTFSNDYMKEMARSLYKEFYSDSEVEQLLADFTGSGTYNVAENKITLIISSDTEALSAPMITAIYSETADKKVTLSMKMEMTVEENGISVPASMEMTYANLVFNEQNTIVCGDLLTKMEMEMDYVENGVSYRIIMEESTQVSFDCSNAAAPKISATTVSKQNMKWGSQSYTEESENTLKIDLSKTTDQFTYIMKSGDDVLAELSSDTLRFGTPSNMPSVPGSVTNLVNQAIQ